MQGQTPWDALLMDKNELCIAGMYDRASFNEYWEGRNLVVNENIGTLQRSSYIPMIAYGIKKNLNIITMLPYISTQSTGGQLAGVSGFQDLSLFLKWKYLDTNIGSSSLKAFVTGGGSLPVSNYITDYMPYSIGMGAPELMIRAIVEYQTASGLYIRAAGGHVWRGYTTIERDYYYQNGSYYSSYMNVPNAWSIHGALGWAGLDGRLRIEGTYWSFRCRSGDDIRSWYRPQPTNKTAFDQIGAFVQYYFKSLPSVSVIGYYNQMIDGKNIGKFSNFTLGATYQFYTHNNPHKVKN